jgi:hypothetical protein
MSKGKSTKVLRSYRLQRSIADLLSEAAKQAGVDEAVLFDAALECFMLDAAPASAKAQARQRSLQVGRELTQLRQLLGQRGGKTMPNARRLPVDVATVLARAIEASSLNETELVEAGLNKYLILATVALVERRETLQAVSTARALAGMVQEASETHEAGQRVPRGAAGTKKPR